MEHLKELSALFSPSSSVSPSSSKEKLFYVPDARWTEKFNKQEESDINFLVVEGDKLTSFYGHCEFLSQISPRLSQQIERVKPNDCLEIKNCSSANFEIFLKYLYTGKLTTSQGNIFKTFFDLLYLSQQFEIQSLETICQKQLRPLFCDSSPKQILAVYQILDLDHHLYALEMITHFIQVNIKAFIPYLETLSPEAFKCLLKGDRLNLDEIDVISMAIEWLDKEENNLELLNEIKSLIRFSNLNIEALWTLREIKIWKNKSLISEEEIGELSKKLSDKSAIKKPREIQPFVWQKRPQDPFIVTSKKAESVSVEWQPLTESLLRNNKENQSFIFQDLKFSLSIQLLETDNNHGIQLLKIQLEPQLVHPTDQSILHILYFKWKITIQHKYPEFCQSVEKNNLVTFPSSQFSFLTKKTESSSLVVQELKPTLEAELLLDSSLYSMGENGRLFLQLNIDLSKHE